MTGTFTVINPATAAPLREVSRASVGEVDAAIARAVSAQRAWSALAPLARADALRSFARVVETHVEELALLEVLNSGHPINSARWEASHVAQVLNFYAGCSGATGRSADPGRGRHRRHVPRAVRRRGHHRAVELPDDDRGVGLRPRARRRQRGRAQAGRAHAAHGDAARRTGARGRTSRGPVRGRHRVGLGRRAALRLAPRRAQGRLHRIDRSRHRCRRGLRPCAQAGHPRARRQERERDLRGCRPRTRGGIGTGVGVRQRGSGLLRTQPHPGAAVGVRPVPRAARTGRGRLAGRRPACSSRPTWVRSSRRRTATP